MKPNSPLPAAAALAVLLGACSPGPAPSPGSRPARPASRLVFQETRRDLGTVDWPGSAETTFRFHNLSDREVGVLDVGASCGCTVPTLRVIEPGGHARTARESAGGPATTPRIVVKPGETGELVVRFETAGTTAGVRRQLATIDVRTDEKDVVQPRVFVEAAIERAYELVPPVLVFEPMGSKQSASLEAKVLVYDPRLVPPFDSQVVSAPSGVEAVVEETIEGGRAVLRVSVLAGPGLPYPLGVSGDVVVESTLAGARRRIPIRVSVPVVPDVHWKPAELDFQVLEPDQAARSAPVVLTLLDPGRRFDLGAPRIEGQAADRLELRTETLQEGRQLRLVLEAPRGLPDAPPTGIHGLVRIATGLGDFPEIRIPYRAFTRSLARR
jgi:hypothetical protein